MSEQKTTWDLIAECDYQISQLNRDNDKLANEFNNNLSKIKQLRERKQSLLNYLNTDSDSINQDKTE